MMPASKKSQTYAKALFEIKGGEGLFAQIKDLAPALSQKEIKAFFLSLAVPLEEKKKALSRAIGKKAPLLKGFFFALLSNKAFALLPEIISAGQKLADEKAGICRGTALSPSLLPEGEKKELERAFEKFFNKTVELQQKEDKKLVSGWIVEIEGYVFDSSALSRLKSFKMKGENVSS